MSLVPWFKLYPYGFASADATPLYIIGIADYVRSSGDLAFARAKWDSLWRAYQWLRSTYGANGFPRNYGVGHGWIEGGPLLPVSSELYQVGVAIQAQQSLANLAGWLHKPEAESLSQDCQPSRAEWRRRSGLQIRRSMAMRSTLMADESIAPACWAPCQCGSGYWTNSVASILERTRATASSVRLGNAHHRRGRSPRTIRRDTTSGSVWPLFTGWASVAEYRYLERCRHTPTSAQMRGSRFFDGLPGRATEVLSRPLLHAGRDQQLAPDLVVGDDCEPTVARHDGALGRRAEFHCPLRASSPGELVGFRHSEYSPGRHHRGIGHRSDAVVPPQSRRDYSGSHAPRRSARTA